MQKMTLVQHFAELRRRVLWTLLIFVGGFGLGWWCAPQLQAFLFSPLMRVWPDGVMLYTGLADGLMIQFSMATLVGLIVGVPAAMWHAWAFAAPGLRKSERNIIWPVLVVSPVLFVFGAAFAFYVLFPIAFDLFVNLNLSSPVPSVLMPAATEYLTFAIGLLKVFGVAFQLPLVMILLNRAGVLSRAVARRMRRYAIVLIFVAAAVLTPPDIVSQLLLAIPLIVLFEIGILFMRRD